MSRLRKETSMSAPKHFYLYTDEAGEWRWHLRSDGNNKIIADSAEGYSSKAAAIHGAKLVASTATGAPVWNAVAKRWEP
jgi:uncharacterized protein YegP (UPF0339 family)